MHSVTQSSRLGPLLQENMKKHIYEPTDQQSSIVLPLDEEEAPQQAFLTEADLPFLTNKSSAPPSSPSSSSSSLSSSSSSTSSSSLDTAPQDGEAVSQPSVLQGTPSQVFTLDSPRQAQHERAEAQQELLKHAEAKVNAQAKAEETPPQPDWGSTPIDAAPVSNLGSATAAGQAAAVDSDQIENESSSGGGSRPRDWHAAHVVPEGLVLQPKVGAIGAPLLQTPTQLPVFALDALLWPNQIMMLRRVNALASSAVIFTIKSANRTGSVTAACFKSLLIKRYCSLFACRPVWYRAVHTSSLVCLQGV